MDLGQIVQQYLSVYGTGVELIERPSSCSVCGQSAKMLHRHGHFERNFFTLTQQYIIPIFRFYCPTEDCGGTTNVVPDFIEKHHPVAVDVKEHVLTRHENGESCEKIEKTTNKFAGGPYSDTTLRRWIQRWKERMDQVEAVFWEWVLTRLPHARLPMGQAHSRKTGSSYFNLWHQVQIHLPAWREIRLFHGILRFLQPLAFTAVGQNPTKDVRRWAEDISRKWK